MGRSSQIPGFSRRANTGWPGHSNPCLVNKQAPPTERRRAAESLWDAERAAEGDEHEQLYRLRKVCEGGIVSAELVEREDALENRQLAERVTFRGEGLQPGVAEGGWERIRDLAYEGRGS